MTIGDALAQAWPAGIATQTLRTIEQAVTVGTDRRYHWFRGHRTTVPVILPGIFREEYEQFQNREVEFWAAQRFRLRAGSIEPKLPAYEDHLAWLLLMQHHGVPTRLVDWTESILVALYFATAEPRDADGEVWCMNPERLNRLSDTHMCQPHTPAVLYLAEEIFTEAKKLPALMERLGIQNSPLLPLALVPPFSFPRMAAQISRFTIHPSGLPERSIECLLRHETELIRYVIPAERKRHLRRDLHSLGITAETLFASLEGLAESIKIEIKDQDYELTMPPHFD